MTPDQFKATRKSLGFTQAELAEEWGVHVQSISKWERGVDPISPLALYALNLIYQMGICAPGQERSTKPRWPSETD